ncbi:paladin isoform X2 [Lepeophtheirus salmonis]
MHSLGDERKISGAPNFRKVSGFPIYGTAQPTEDAYEVILEEISKNGHDDPDMIWYNMRQEPVIYINKIPYAPRYPNMMHENIEIGDPVPELDNLQRSFVIDIKNRLAESKDGSITIHRDSCYTENPMEREDVEESLKVESLKGLHNIFAELTTKHMSNQSYRVPVVEERAPAEECFDIIVNSLKDKKASIPCVFSCQMGRGRTTLGLIVASLIKEVQITTELKRMAEIGLIPPETVDNLIKQKFETNFPQSPDDEDPFIKGEFDVIKELLEKVPETIEGKRKIDRIIDICGPKGGGLQNLRECIIETKWKYDVAPEEKQVVWKRMILNFMERYFYLILFATYASEVGPEGFKSSFSEWMNARTHLRTMIEEGKDKLEWYRQVDPQKLNTLKELINAPNYEDNLTTLIKTIYEFAFLTYSDLPRGPIKNNSMRKLAAKTLLEILPPHVGQEIQKKLDEHLASPDFVTLIGLVSQHCKQRETEVTV